ncbi:hypothetical protein Bca4012_042031 [Brassica carinata]
MVLLGLVLAAAVVTAKKRGRRAKREDMERKTYEEEALRVVTMVGHSRVLVAICYKDFVWLRVEKEATIGVKLSTILE